MADRSRVWMKGGVMTRFVMAVLVLAAIAAAPAAAAPEQTPKRGGTLVIGIRTIDAPSCLDVFACRPSIGLPGLLREVLPGAFEVNPDGTYQPDLVSRADIVSRPPTIVYRIRPEARWSDGVPVTASDFVFTDRLRRTHHLPADVANGPGSYAWNAEDWWLDR